MHPRFVTASTKQLALLLRLARRYVSFIGLDWHPAKDGKGGGTLLFAKTELPRRLPGGHGTPTIPNPLDALRSLVALNGRDVTLRPSTVPTVLGPIAQI
jgi:hypothetical protein